MNEQDLEYAGFWIRVGASLIDTVLLLMIIVPVLTAIYGEDYWLSGRFIYGFWDLVFSYILPAIAIVLFWVYRSATPGKMALRLSIVDARTGGRPSLGQFVVRYIGYFVATIPVFLGLIWVGIDPRKQGWHDKMAGTVVVRHTRGEPVVFEDK
jgi:uncharacterized RDD family membrane protein YckC